MEIINLKNAIELDFENIISNKLKCDDCLNEIEEIIEKIGLKYTSLINQIHTNKNIEIPIYLGIDSLNFQNKQLTLKYLNLQSVYKKLFNRIYADYYKIHKLIKNYIINNTTIASIDITFTPYKDLDNQTLYSFQETCKIQNTIYQYIQSLYDIITKKNISIQPFIKSNNAGYAVDYYLSEENTNINIYTNKCLLFINYLTTFNKYHNSYLLDFLLQSRFLIATIKKDIDFNNENDILNISEYVDEIYNNPNHKATTVSEIDNLEIDISTNTVVRVFQESLDVDLFSLDLSNNNSPIIDPSSIDLSNNSPIVDSSYVDLSKTCNPIQLTITDKDLNDIPIDESKTNTIGNLCNSNESRMSFFKSFCNIL